jgi:hypothetical protein
LKPHKREQTLVTNYIIDIKHQDSTWQKAKYS